MPIHKVKTDEPVEQVIEWELRENHEGRVFLQACDELCSSLLCLEPDGTVSLCTSFNKRLGMQVDGDGKVLVNSDGV